MLKLQKPVTFNEYIKPLALANSNLLLNCSVSGWGGFHLSNGALVTMPLNNIRDFGYYLEAVMLASSGLLVMPIVRSGFQLRK
uniref:Uncharacterized protein n=1 Tax=Romanomermis culicivorax TaxID=13658 RepID=A0A915L529_ROMCU